MAELITKWPRRVSRHAVQLMMEMKQRLRQHNVSIGLTAPDAIAQFIQASEQIEDDHLSQLCGQLIAAVTDHNGSHQMPPEKSTAGLLPNPNASDEKLTTSLTNQIDSSAALVDPSECASEQGCLCSANDGSMTDSDEMTSTQDQSELEAVKVFIRAIQRNQLICQQCQSAIQLTETQQQFTGPFDVECACGSRFQVSADVRRHPRKATQLPGRYIDLKQGGNGDIVVENISFGGVQFLTTTSHLIMRRDFLQILFKLDDEGQSPVSESVYVRHVQGNRIGARFVSTDDFDHRLAAYLIR